MFLSVKEITKFNETEHYAEMWMGTHPSAPSKIELVEESKEFLSEAFIESSDDLKLIDLIKA